MDNNEKKVDKTQETPKEASKGMVLAHRHHHQHQIDSNETVDDGIHHDVDCFTKIQNAAILAASKRVSQPTKSKSRHTHTKEMHETYKRRVVEAMVRHPLVSPLRSLSLVGVPPLLVQAGEAEVLRDETLAFARRVHNDNLHENVHDLGRGWVRHELYHEMVHIFQTFFFLEASKVAMESVGVFVRMLEEKDLQSNGDYGNAGGSDGDSQQSSENDGWDSVDKANFYECNIYK
jgi:hypothetical protein